MKINILNPIKSNEAGATLLEYTLVVLLLLGLIGALYEGGMYYMRYSILDYTTRTVIRRLSVDVGMFRCASTLKTEAENMSQNIIKSTLGYLPSDITFVATISPYFGGYYILTVDGEWSAPSVIGLLFAGNATIQHSKLSVIGDDCFQISGVC